MPGVEGDVPDYEGRGSGRAKSARVDLGLAVMSAMAERGAMFTREEIGAFADCSGEAIRLIERRALRKLRRRFQDAPELQEYFNGKHRAAD